MTQQEILKKAKWNNHTIYGQQITYTFETGRMIQVPLTKEGMSRSQAEEILVEKVQKELED